MRYAALLRGVSPMNCSMPKLKAALEHAGFDDVKTVISSGNAVFTTRRASESSIERKCEEAMERHMGRRFLTIVRSIDDLATLLDQDRFAGHALPANAKRNVTFLRVAPRPAPKLPVVLGSAEILALHGREAYTCYVPGDASPTFMTLIETTFGTDVTTRTWDTIGRIVKAAR